MLRATFMHIGLVRRGYSPTGGAESYLRRLGAALMAGGHRATLFASPQWPRAEWPVDADLIPVPGRGPRAFADGLAALEPRRRCDLLFSLERVGTCDCYRAGDGLHRAWLERRARFEPAWRSRLRRWNPKHRQILALEDALFGNGGAGFIIANSSLVRDEIAAHFPAFPPARVAVVYNGLPATLLAPADPAARETTRRTLGLEPDDCVLLFAGTGWERKGLACTLGALARLPDATRPRLLVAGRGDPRPYGRRWKNLAGCVRFLGPVRDMPALYAAADLFVLPTIYDPFSNACLEALAAGLPVLTTTANGFAEILTPGMNGDTVAPGDADVLADLITRWADPARRLAARAAAVEAARPFTIERNVAETLNIFARLASNQPASAD